MAKNNRAWVIEKGFLGIGSFLVLSFFVPFFLIIFLFLLLFGKWVIVDGGVKKSNK